MFTSSPRLRATVKRKACGSEQAGVVTKATFASPRPAHAAGSSGALAEGAPIRLRLSQTDLARMLATARSRTNGALKRLEKGGLLKVGYCEITLTDVFAF